MQWLSNRFKIGQKVLNKKKTILSQFRQLINWVCDNRYRFMLFIFCLAFLLRLAFVCMLGKDRFYFSDARHYDAAAISLIDGEGFDVKYTRAPFYPIVMAGIYYVFGHSFLVMRLFQSVLGALLCLLIFEIGTRVFNSRIGVISALAAIFFPHFVFISGLLYPTIVFSILIALTVLFLLKADMSWGMRNSILAGELAGLATLTEASMIFFLPFLAIWILAQTKVQWTKRLLFLSVLLATMLLIMSPWLLRGYKIYGRFTLVRPLPHTVLPNLDSREQTLKEAESGWQKTTQYRVQNPTGTDKDRIINLAMVYIRNPLGTIRHVVGELGHFWALFPDRLDTQKSEYREKIRSRDQRMAKKNIFVSDYIKYVSIAVLLPVFVLALLGFIHSGLRTSAAWLLFLLVMSFALGYSMLYAEVRYRIPVEPYILIFAAAGFTYIIEFFQRINLTLKRADFSNKVSTKKNVHNSDSIVDVQDTTN
jgi:4-amino-4-deoxy-L-arabinose transferase-like glycosyltransferase